MTPEQRLVNEAYAHIHKTEKASVNEEGTCLYSGSGCAFSPAIKPSFRKKLDANNQNAGALLEYHPEKLEDWVVQVNPEFANDVQACHDDSSVASVNKFLESFDKRLKALCDQEGFTFPGDTQ